MEETTKTPAVTTRVMMTTFFLMAWCIGWYCCWIALSYKIGLRTGGYQKQVKNATPKEIAR